jgi:Phosphotransferase enzyme family
MARLGGYSVWDKVTRKQVESLTEVPAKVSQLTPQWLTAALCSGSPGAQVESLEVLGGSSGSTNRDRIKLSYNIAGQSADLPDFIFAKSSPKFTSRLIAGLTGALAGEGGFYRDFRPKVQMNTPQSYYIAHDTKTERSMFLLEDVSRSRGATFGSPVSMYVDRPMAESMVRNLAAYHGAFWEHDMLRSLPWIQSSLDFQMRVDETIGFEKRSLIGVERSREFIPKVFVARRREIWPALMRALSRNNSGPTTLLHSDMHIGNWYQDDQGEMGLYDWQCMTVGGWALDVSYALASALTVEDRRDWERDLLRLYLDALAENGGTAPTFDAAWTEYRHQVLHGLVFWLYTIGAGSLQPDMQPYDISRANVIRLVQATVDHDSLDLR